MTDAAGHAGWSPARWLGAPAPGRLALPAASPTAGHLDAPRGVWLDGERLVVCDSGGHRILIWRRVPAADRPADVVLGQPDFTTAAELPHPPQGLARPRFPDGIAVAGGVLAVADTANHRLLLRPLSAGEPGKSAAAVIGQENLLASGENHWKAVAADTLCWPYGVCGHGNRLAVADSGNNRVMLWQRGGD